MTPEHFDWPYDLIVVGGGPAGMAAAAEAKKAGLERVLIAERGEYLGGVLPQCIHDGFGLTEFQVSMSGPEYAEILEKTVEDAGVQVLTDTTVIRMSGDGPYTLSLTGLWTGLLEIGAKSIVFATGCRERSFGALRIPGSRPAGIYTAGTAQYMINRQNYLPGKSVVILGSGDVGLIMARRLTLEGAKVKMILGEQASGLLRNYIQCVQDFDIPIRFGYTILRTHGYKRLTGVTIAPLDKNGKPDESGASYVPCDTLLIAAGLIPEAELWRACGFSLGKMGGLPVDGYARTPKDGIFACGNVTRIFDTVDEVTENGKQAGYNAAQWVLEGAGGSPEFKENETAHLMSLGRKITGEDIRVLFGAQDGGNDKTVYCIKCPLGCKVEISGKGGEVSLSGAGCEIGETYAREEYQSPVRVVTSTVKVKGGAQALLPVKTNRPVPKGTIRDVMALCRRIHVEPPVKMGDLLAKGPADAEWGIIAAASSY